MRLNQLPIDKNSILLRSQPRQEKLAFLLNDDIVTLFDSDGEFVSLREGERKHTKVFHGRLSINQNTQVSDELVEGEVHPMFFVHANHEAELHTNNLSTRCLVEELLNGNAALEMVARTMVSMVMT